MQLLFFADIPAVVVVVVVVVVTTGGNTHPVTVTPIAIIIIIIIPTAAVPTINLVSVKQPRVSIIILISVQYRKKRMNRLDE